MDTSQIEIRDECLVIYRMKKGDVIPLHDHPWDHFTIIAAGAATIFGVDGDIDIFLPNANFMPFLMPAKKQHGIRSEIDGTVVMNVMVRGDIAGVRPLQISAINPFDL